MKAGIRLYGTVRKPLLQNGQRLVFTLDSSQGIKCIPSGYLSMERRNYFITALILAMT